MGLKLRGFCSPMNLAMRGCSEHPCTVIPTVTLSVAGKGERWYLQGQQERDAGFLLLTFDFSATTDFYSSPRDVMLHTEKV